jgi:vancomycin resistance protein VanJ
LVTAAVAYPAALALVWVLLRWVGERSWITTVGLYLPTLLFALPLPLLSFRLWRRGRRRWLISPGIAALVLIFPLGGFVLPGSPARDERAPTIRVLSYNVMHAYAGPRRIAAEIERFAPDVVLLEKLSANQEEMAALLRARYPQVELAGGSLVASRFPILSRHPPQGPLPDDEWFQRGYVQKVIDTPLGPIAFYSAHLRSPRDGLRALGSLQGGALAQLREETALRVGQTRELARRARGETLPVVIAGDTNLPALSPILHDQLGRYQDAFRAAGWGFGYTYPINLFRWMRIDRILVSDALRVVRFQIGGSDASDHLCVVAELQRAH